MKRNGLILILAGIVVILAGIAIYGFAGLPATGFTPGEFDARYDSMAKLGQLDFLANNSALLNFFLRYRVGFAIAWAVALLGGAGAVLLRKPGKKA
jgi:hypothetical protein